MHRARRPLCPIALATDNELGVERVLCRARSGGSLAGSPVIRGGKSAVSIEQRVRELGLELPAAPSPAANYVNAVRTGNLVFTSGTVAATADGQIPKGKVGADVTTEEAAQHARMVGLNLLAVLKHELGDLDRVRRVVKLLGMVNAVPDYREHSKVVNGCSDLFVEVFGEQHARSAIGVGSLPFGITVEIEAIVEVE